MLNYRRHKNGSGKVYNEAFVSRDSYLDNKSTVEGDCNLHRCGIYNSAVKDSALFACAMTGGVIIDSQISDAVISHSALTNCIVSGMSTLSRVTLTEVAVDGAAQLIGPWKLEGPYHIQDGIWHRPPRTLLLEDECGIRVGITEGTDGAFIACEYRGIDEWLKSGIRIGLHLGWPEYLCRKAFDFIQELRDVPLSTEWLDQPSGWFKEIDSMPPARRDELGIETIIIPDEPEQF